MHAYDDYYDIAVDAGEIGVEQFAKRVQTLLVQYLRARYGSDTANWCEKYWTGDRGRYCLVHSRYGGCNNNMGVEVTWRDIKKFCTVLMRLGAFIGALCHFIATALGEENMKRLKDDSGVPDAFIRKPRPTREMYDLVQETHRLTLSCCIILDKPTAEYAFFDLMAEVMECGADTAPLHMKIAIYHHQRAETGDQLPLALEDVKTVLMPRQRLFNLVDPDGDYEFNAPQMRRLIRPYAEEYTRVVLRDQLPPGMTVKEAIKVYKNFKLFTAKPSWGAVPMACSCKTCFGHAISADTLLFVSLFDPEVHVPKRMMKTTVSERKKNKFTAGLAGRKKRRVLDELKDDEKQIHYKALLLAETAEPIDMTSPRAELSPRTAPTAPKPLIVPAPVMPTDDEGNDDDDDDFAVAICFRVCGAMTLTRVGPAGSACRIAAKTEGAVAGEGKQTCRHAAASSQPSASGTSRRGQESRRSSTQPAAASSAPKNQVA